MEINSKDYWDQRFEEDWERNLGTLQSEYFAKLALRMMPPGFKEMIGREKLSILDWGCAEGEGAHVLKSRFPNSPIYGIDISDKGIERAGKKYPDIAFVADDIRGHNGYYDVTFTSNVLEHFKDPFEWWRHLLRRTNHFNIIMVPFREAQLLEEHFTTFNYMSFPMEIYGFHLMYHKVVRPSRFWGGEQILLIYGNSRSRLFPYLRLDLFDYETLDV